MEELLRREIAGRTAVAAVTERSDGDLHPERVEPDALRSRQERLTGSPWVMLDEVHGTAVVALGGAARPWAPVVAAGDALIANGSTDHLAVWAADCAPVALFGADGTTLAMVHAGWRGLAGGVIDAAVDALESTGTTAAAAVLGPCIHPCCYEFGIVELEQVADGVGLAATGVVGETSWGAVALDVPAAVAGALERRGILLDTVGACTGCVQRFYSHRRRADPERHALVAWFEHDRADRP